MKKYALFVTHHVKPGRFDDFKSLWEREIRPRVELSPGHERYSFCRNERDPDLVQVFQIYSDREAAESFLSGSWYPAYLGEVRELIASESIIDLAEILWEK